MYWNAVLVDQTYTEASGTSKEVYIANLYGIFSYVSLKLFWLLLSQPLHRAPGCWVALAQLLLPQYGLKFRGSIWLMGTLDSSRQFLLRDYFPYRIHGTLLAGKIPVALLFKLGVDRSTWLTLEQLVMEAHLGMRELGGRAAWPHTVMHQSSKLASEEKGA